MYAYFGDCNTVGLPFSIMFIAVKQKIDIGSLKITYASAKVLMSLAIRIVAWFLRSHVGPSCHNTGVGLACLPVFRLPAGPEQACASSESI